MKGFKFKAKAYILIALVCVVSLPSQIIFAQSTSPNYRLEEAYFGTGGELDASSTNYRSQQSAGSLGIGNSSSTNFDAAAGNVTPFIPFLEFVVSGDPVDFGVLSDTSTSYGASVGGDCACSFYVKSYLSSEYVIVNASNQPPTSEGGAFLDPKSTKGMPSSNQNVEEFGFNLVANTSPGTFGANPVNIPDNSFADGKIESDYATPNEFKFGAGDILARSPNTAGNQAVGQTNYTISYIAKRKPLTEAGSYTLNHDLVAVPTY